MLLSDVSIRRESGAKIKVAAFSNSRSWANSLIVLCSAMSNTIFSCSVWCEKHGPTNIFCTQTSDTTSNTSTTTPLSQATSPETPTSAAPTSTQSKGSCASCSLTLPHELTTNGVAPCIKTKDGCVTYISLRHPTSQDRYKAVRSACIRALSCESVPGRMGPVFFGDPSIGYTIAYIFRLRNPTSSTSNTHDARRQYALMCTTTEEQELLQSWTFITERFRVLAQKITDGGKDVSERQTLSSARAKLSSESISMDRDRSFLRPKGRAAEKGLAELSGMDDVFVQLHAAFAWMLGVWRMHFEDTTQVLHSATANRGLKIQDSDRDITSLNEEAGIA